MSIAIQFAIVLGCLLPLLALPSRRALPAMRPVRVRARQPGVRR